MATVESPAQRAAIYTRKSTDQGLDQQFTTLDNQRERGEMYAVSQGWEVVADRYDDGGFSGGTIDRPALQRLLDDVKAGRIDVILTYRLDRISRSLVDFGRIHEFLERHGVALVSVTESIDTSTAHGRMMVNVLLSFAQYERELIGERTRDKMHAARRRGQWTGGRPPLGYDVTPKGGEIVINKTEAEEVRAIFSLYSQTPSLITVVQELNRRGWRQKSWTTKTGKRCGGRQWNRTSLRTLLTNPLYTGHQKLGDEVFPGDHAAIVTKKLFDQVQALMEANRISHGGTVRNGNGYLLRGLLRCASCDSSMTPHTSKSKGRAYRYYTCVSAQKRGHEACPSKSIRADSVEQAVVEQIQRLGADPSLQRATFDAARKQLRQNQRDLRAERRRIAKRLAELDADVGRLTGAVSRVTGPAAEPLVTELEAAVERRQVLERRRGEVDDELAELKQADVDEPDVDRALEAFTPIWDALLLPERERVIKLLVNRVAFDRVSAELTVEWRLAGFGEFAGEVES